MWAHRSQVRQLFQRFSCVSPRSFPPWECAADMLAPTLIRLSEGECFPVKVYYFNQTFYASNLIVTNLTAITCLGLLKLT